MSVHNIPVDEFAYEYPKEQVAMYPPAKRGISKLMVVDASRFKTDLDLAQQKPNHPSQEVVNLVEHKHYYDIPLYLSAGDTVVINNVKVINARLIGSVKTTRLPIEIFLVTPQNPGDLNSSKWYALLGPAKRIRRCKTIILSPKYKATVLEKLQDGRFLLEFNDNVLKITDELGQVPIPKYIKRKATTLDQKRYQTIAAKIPGAIAAPTASLNLTPDILEALKAKGVNVAYITLFVGWATFAPLRDAQYLQDFKMPAEYVVLPKDTATILNQTISNQKKILAFGTTVTRTLEGVMSMLGSLRAYQGLVDLFITPGYKFKVVNHLVTNFHPPKTTPLVLVSSILGLKNVKLLYRHAIDKNYRLFSYGDSMLILNII